MYERSDCTIPTTIPHVCASSVCRHNTKEPPSPWTDMRIDVLVVLEGPSDRVTAPTFRDIAETVQNGLHGLGHPSTIVYCANIAFDDCVAGGGKVIVLAAHNLASFSTMEGESVVLKWKLLPPDAGKVRVCRMHIFAPLKTVLVLFARSDGILQATRYWVTLENGVGRVLLAHHQSDFGCWNCLAEFVLSNWRCLSLPAESSHGLRRAKPAGESTTSHLL